MSNNNANNLSANTNSCLINNEEFWYPVPIKNAHDYYEQLDQILPSQYEILLKQIMRKYKLSEGLNDSSTNLNSNTNGNGSNALNFDIYPKTSSSAPTSPVLSTPITSTTTMINTILKTNNSNNCSNANISNQLNVHMTKLAPTQNSPLNWKNVWDYFYETVIIFRIF
jgi:hypothetical protein